MTLTLEQAKGHLRVIHGAEDALITGLIGAALDWLQGVGVAEEDLGRPAVLQAALLLIGHWYTNREAVGAADLRQVPLAVSALIAPFRKVLT